MAMGERHTSSEAQRHGELSHRDLALLVAALGGGPPARAARSVGDTTSSCAESGDAKPSAQT
jgi:hypothetical protein